MPRMASSRLFINTYVLFLETWPSGVPMDVVTKPMMHLAAQGRAAGVIHVF